MINDANISTFHQLSSPDLQAIQAVLQGNKQPKTDFKKEKPQDRKARQPHTLAQAKQTDLCSRAAPSHVHPQGQGAPGKKQWLLHT